jgi:rhodanese-related sulfurtransferase
VIPGALFAHPADAKASLSDCAPETEVVVYCACPNDVSAVTAVLHLRRTGFRKIRPLLGGVEAWIAAGREIVRPPAAAESVLPELQAYSRTAEAVD